jgi:DNA-binding transcriptional LysR family regulator
VIDTGRSADIDEIRPSSDAELGGFTRAAGRLNRSQPAISRRIGLIEQDFGSSPGRTRGGAKLTEAGAPSCPSLPRPCSPRSRTDARRCVRRRRRRAVSLALVGTLADTHIVEVLRQFTRRSKSINLDLRTASSQESRSSAAREATWGCRFDNPHPDLISRAVGNGPAGDLRGGSLAGKRGTTPRQLRGERSPPAARGRDRWRRAGTAVAVAGLAGAAVTLIDSLTAQRRLVEAGFGIALVPASSVRDEIRLGAVKMLDAPALRTTVPVMLIHRRKGYLSAAARALLALMSSASLRLGDERKPKKRP